MATQRLKISSNESRIEGGSNRTYGIRPLAGALGAEIIGIDLSHPLDESSFHLINQALMDYLVVFISGQKELAPDQLTSFARKFGEIDLAPFAHPLKMPSVEGHPEIFHIVKEAKDRSINLGGFWHTDVTYRERPHSLGLMYSEEAPTFGGDTMFANQYLAYETLSEGMKKMLGGLKAVHSSAMSYAGESARFGAVSRTHAPTSDDRKFAREKSQVDIIENEHPVVRTHPETKRKSLYVNRGFTSRFAGMSEEESRPLLEYLWSHATRPEFTCRYQWSANTVGIWDNRCTLHYALNDYYGQRRSMYRISLHESARPE